MKYIIILTLVGMGFIGANSMFQPKPPINDEIESSLSQMKEKYDSAFYICLYAIEELRPFSIIQFDKTTEMYKDNWVAPQNYLSVLSNEERVQLEQKILHYIKEKPQYDQKRILEKIDKYCNMQQHFDYLEYTYQIDDELLLEASLNIESTRNIFDKYNRLGNKLEIKQLKENEKDEAMVNTVNHILNLNKKYQLIYFSQLYAHIANK